MKNMKISAKLLTGFAIVAVIAAIIGTFGAIMIFNTDTAYSLMLVKNNSSIMTLANLREDFQKERVALRNIVIACATEKEKIEGYINDFNDIEKTVSDSFAAYEATITDKAAESGFFAAKDAYKGAFSTATSQIITSARAGDINGALNGLKETATQAVPIQTGLGDTVSYNDHLSNAESTRLTNGTIQTVIVQLALAAFGVIVAMILGVYISRLLSIPTVAMSKALALVGSTGSLTLPADIAKVAAETSTRKDELGVAAIAFSGLMQRLAYVSENLETVANGDLTAEIAVASNDDVMGSSLKKMSDNLNKMFTEINSATTQVSTGSSQVADGAQILAQGATEQAATVEALSASVTEISEKTKINAATAEDAKSLGDDIKKSAEQGTIQMQQMMQAVREINEASQSIGKVIKIIDDIAFQTNILALNAAVEAARAGQHGKGFAVVADEVRSLAAKSAEAAKNTNELIESSIQKAEQGASISEQTSISLQQIVEGILRSSQLIAQIADSSTEQAGAIGNISDSIGQVSQVVQQNSATAEESAAASEEMSGQANLLQQLIGQFKIRGGSSSYKSSFSNPAPRATLSSSLDTGFSVSSSKY